MDVEGQENVTSVKYWDSVARDWQSEIQDTLSEDQDRVIYNALDEFVGGAVAVLDLGCGVGNYLPALAARAERVFGVDISPRCIEVARQLCARRRLANCSLRVTDLGHAHLHELSDFLPDRVPVAICMNVLISPDPVTRREILATAYRALLPPEGTSGEGGEEGAEAAPAARAAEAPDGAPRRAPTGLGGVLMLVAPAVESALLVRERRRLLAQGHGRQLRPSRHVVDEAAGVFRRSGVRTKHFRREELEAALADGGFEVLRIQRVPYDWNTELPGCNWVGDPRPFDWLALSRRVCSDPEPPARALEAGVDAAAPGRGADVSAAEPRAT